MQPLSLHHTQSTLPSSSPLWEEKRKRIHRSGFPLMSMMSIYSTRGRQTAGGTHALRSCWSSPVLDWEKEHIIKLSLKLSKILCHLFNYSQSLQAKKNILNQETFSAASEWSHLKASVQLCNERIPTSNRTRSIHTAYKGNIFNIIIVRIHAVHCRLHLEIEAIETRVSAAVEMNPLTLRTDKWEWEQMLNGERLVQLWLYHKLNKLNQMHER